MVREILRSPMGGRPPSVLAQVEAFLNGNYPAAYTPGIITSETGLDHEGVKKAVQILVKQGRISRPLGDPRGFYRGVPAVTNISNFEDPPVTIHNLTWLIEIDPKIVKGIKSGGSPPGLYTQGDRHKIGTMSRAVNGSEGAASWFEAVEYWDNQGTPCKAILQFYPASVTVHLNATLKPVLEVQMSALMSWLRGLVQAYGVNVAAVTVDIVKAELNKDYELITITPSSLLIQDLLNKSWLRIYRKMRNLHRLEIGTTYKGDLALFKMFKEFGRPAIADEVKDDKDNVMFG